MIYENRTRQYIGGRRAAVHDSLQRRDAVKRSGF